ncbi:MAG: corrinoid protein [Oscillospiraceae bacterium]|jgi:corrinoid protein of di/trimethylamine methyltransferase|nr:corrinoid protein [Oscillospiraceae bacterium]
MSKIQEIATAVESGKVKLIEGLVQEALDAGENPNDILDNGMVAAMAIIGAKFQANEVFVPEMLVAAKTMKKGVEILRPRLASGSLGKLGKNVIGTVAGDLHDIGKNLVALMIESAGFEIIDLGVDVPPEKFVEALNENPDCKIVGASALLTTTMDSLRKTVEAIHGGGYKDKVKIMIGGAPVTQEFADEIGADAYTPDAGSAASKAIELVS